MTKTLINAGAIGSDQSGTFETKPGQVTHSVQYVTRNAGGVVVLGPTLVRLVDYAVRAIRARWETATSTLHMDATLAEGQTDEWTTVSSTVIVLGASATITVRGYPAN